jgi:tetratricopeptide (TPR) repeat protein
MIAVITGALLLAASFQTSQLPDASTRARDALNKGVSAFRNGEYESAVAFFTQAVQIDPNMSAAELYLATAYAQRYVPGVSTRENLAFGENAIASFKRLLDRNPNDVNALLGLAGIYQNTSDLQNARETYLTASKLMPTNPATFYAIGSVDWLLVFDRQNPLPFADQVRLIEEGLASLDSALALNPQYDDAMTYKNLLLREKARLAVDPAEKSRLTALADSWFERALETRKTNAASRRTIAGSNGATGFAPPPPPPPPGR